MNQVSKEPSAPKSLIIGLSMIAILMLSIAYYYEPAPVKTDKGDNDTEYHHDTIAPWYKNK